MKWLWEDPMGVLLLAAVSLMLLISIVAAVRAVMLALRVRRFRKAVTKRYAPQFNALQNHVQDRMFGNLGSEVAKLNLKENPRGNQNAD